MNYTIEGGNLPVVKINLTAGEELVCESGAMSWMDDEIEMATEAGGLGKMLGRMVTKEHAFMNRYVARKGGEIALASSFPGSIKAIELTPGKDIIIQKGSFLAYYGDIQNEVYIQQKIGNGFFGGEGFLMRRYSGTGTVFLEIDGSAHVYDIPEGDCKVIDTGYVAAMDGTCKMEIRRIKGVKNVLFGGEGFFNTVVRGPGKVIIQSMPIAATAMVLYALMPHSN